MNTSDNQISTSKSRVGTSRRLLPTIAVFCLLAIFPFVQETLGIPSYLLVYLYFIFFWVTQATSWNIFSGYAGYFSFAQGAFYGAGVYTTVLLVEHLNAPIYVTIPSGALIAGLIALAAGAVVFGLRSLSGEIFALFSLSLGLGLGLIANNVAAIDGGQGRILGDVSYPTWLGSVNQMLYIIAFLLAAIAVLCSYIIQHSRMGYGLAAIRDDELVGGTLGVPTLRYKLTAFTIGGAIAGASGSLHAVLINFITPDAAFGQYVPFYVIVMCVIGGRRHWSGPIIGAVLIQTTNDRLVSLGLAEINQILVGLLLILVVVRLPAGIGAELLARPRPAVISGLTVAALVFVSGVSHNVIWIFLSGMLGALAVLLAPARSFKRRRRPKVQAQVPTAVASADSAASTSLGGME